MGPHAQPEPQGRDFFGLIEPYAVPAPPDDQVPRLGKFRAEHPDWKIGFDHTIGVWRALRLRDGGSDTHVRYLLRDLLDALGAPYPGGDEQ